MDLSIVIPVYNEEKTIKHTLLNLKEKLKGDYEIIVVDDYSFDKTHRSIEELLCYFTNLELVTNQYKKGFANALRTGFNLTRKKVVIPVMADFCDDIELILPMYNKIINGYDIVSTSRYIKGGKRQGGPIFKAVLSICVSWLLHKITGIPTTDLTNSFKAYRKSVLKNIFIESKGFEISMEIMLKAHLKGYKITEMPTNWKERTVGQSHFAIFRDGIKFVKWFVFGLGMPFLRINSGYISDK